MLSLNEEASPPRAVLGEKRGVTKAPQKQDMDRKHSRALKSNNGKHKGI